MPKPLRRWNASKLFSFFKNLRKPNKKPDFLELAQSALRSELRKSRREAVFSLAEYGKSRLGRVNAEKVFLMLKPLALEEESSVRRAALLGIADISPYLSRSSRQQVSAIISGALHSGDFRAAKTANVALYTFENSLANTAKRKSRNSKRFSIPNRLAAST